PGTYSATGAQVSSGPATYRTTQSSVEVRSGESATLTLTYQVVPGSLNVSATGLPAGVFFSFTLSGPAPATTLTSHTGPKLLNDLTPGTYTLAFAEVVHNGERYAPPGHTISLNVTSSQTAQATASYSLGFGTLALNHALTPGGSLTLNIGDGINAPQQVTLSGSGTHELTLSTGSYELTVASNNLGTDLYGNPYQVEGADIGFSIVGGQSTQVSLSARNPTLVTRNDNQGPGSLREVIGRVNAGSVITFAPSVTRVTTETRILVDKELSLVGPGPAQLTLTTTGDDRLFSFLPQADVHLENLRIADIDTTQGSPAIHSSGRFSLRNVVIENNATSHDVSGGAITISDATGELLIEDSTFRYNNSNGDFGGAIFNDLHGHTLVILRSKFEDNYARYAGGAISSKSSLEVEDTLFKDNFSDSNGGAISVPYTGISTSSYTLVLRRTLFQNNTAETHGGAVYASNKATVENVTFVDNHANNSGGAYYQFDKDATLVHTTFLNNSAGTGNAIASLCDAATSITLGSSIIAGNANAFTCLPSLSTRTLIASRGHNYIQSDDTVDDFIADPTDQVGTSAAPLANPLLPLSNNGGFTHTAAINPAFTTALTITAASCLDAAGQPLTEDQRGNARPVNGMCALGAWEFDPSALQSFEPFYGHGLSSQTYFSGIISTAQGYYWELIGVRAAGAYQIAGEGLMFRQVGDYVRSVNLSGTLSEISVDYRKAFAGSAARQIAIAVNGTVVATSPTFGASSGADETVHTLTASGLNFSGDYTIEIQNLTPADGQVVIDNLRWH
ncbi:hypothetical protein DL240_19455, partial [Lujinxingia litoralis]